MTNRLVSAIIVSLLLLEQTHPEPRREHAKDLQSSDHVCRLETVHDGAYTILGLSVNADPDEVQAFRQAMQSTGFRIRIIPNDYPDEVDGLNARDLSKEAFEVLNTHGTVLMTVLLEKNGSIAMICGAEFVPSVVLKLDGETALSPGLKSETVRTRFASALVQDLGWRLTIRLPHGWLVCKFVKETLYSITLSAGSRGPSL